jgi:uroporphyrinogen-III synthase
VTKKPVVIVTCTQPKADAFVTRLRGLGYPAHAMPVLEAVGTYLPCPDLYHRFSGYILTSMQALRFLPADIPKDLPLFAVGDATAEAARSAGFQQVCSAAGDVNCLAAFIQAKNTRGQLLHVCGVDLAACTKAVFEAAGLKVVYWPVYRTIKKVFDIKAFLGEPPCFFTLHSPKGAQVFVAGLPQGVETQKMSLLCLSRAVVDYVPEINFGCVRIAETPDEKALINLLENFNV